MRKVRGNDQSKNKSGIHTAVVVRGSTYVTFQLDEEGDAGERLHSQRVTQRGVTGHLDTSTHGEKAQVKPVQTFLETLQE